MSLNEERMLILNMLKEGRITSEEAARLLEALEGGTGKSEHESRQGKSAKTGPNYYDEVAKLKERINRWKEEFNKNYKAEDFEKAIDDFTKKAEKVGRDVAAATFGAIDKVIDYVGNIIDTGSLNLFGTYPAMERTFEADAAEGKDIEIEGTNGQIIVKKHQDNKIIIKTTVRSPKSNPDSFVHFKNEPSCTSVKLLDAGYSSISHEVLLPDIKFGKIYLSTKNSKIHVEDIVSREFTSITKNAAAELIGVTGDSILVDTRNAKADLKYVTGKDVTVRTENAEIAISNIKASTLKASTANGRIAVDNVFPPEEGTAPATIDLRTKSGGIRLNMNDTGNTAYRVKAQTTNGGINLLIPGLKYTIPVKQAEEGRQVEAETENYEGNPQKVDIYAETLNGGIEIIK